MSVIKAPTPPAPPPNGEGLTLPAPSVVVAFPILGKKIESLTLQESSSLLPYPPVTPLTSSLVPPVLLGSTIGLEHKAPETIGPQFRLSGLGARTLLSVDV